MLYVVLMILPFGISTCLPQLSQSLTKSTSRFSYIVNSGKGIDDLGKYNECLDSHSTKYALVVADHKYSSKKLILGLCLHESCSGSDIKSVINSLVAYSNTSIINTDKIEVIFPKDYSEKPIPVSSILISILFMIYFILVAYSSFSYSRQRKATQPNAHLKSMLLKFAFQKNIEKITKLKKTEDPLDSISGIRVLAACTLLIFHILSFTLRVATANPKHIQEMQKEFKRKIILSFTYNADIFFVISGFLMSYLIMKEINEKGKDFSWLKFIIKRFIRYTPVFYFVCTFYFFIFKYTSSGPQWPMIDKVFPTCDDYWWTCYLYLQNFIPFEDIPCMGWLFYIPLEFSFFLISPLIISLYKKSKTLGYLICLALLAVNFLYVGIISTDRKLSPSFSKGFAKKTQYGLLVDKPFARISPFLVGITIGWIYRNFRDGEGKEKKLRSFGENFEMFCIKIVGLNKVRRLLYLAGISIIIWVCFIVYQLDDNGEDHWTQGEKSTYLVFHRFFYALGFSFLMFPLLMGHGKPVSKVLSWNGFQILARVSYSFYCTIVILILFFFYSRSQAVIVENSLIFMSTLSALFIGWLMALVIAATIEYPFKELGRKFLKD